MKTARLETALAGLVAAAICAPEAKAADGASADLAIQLIVPPGLQHGIVADATTIVERVYQSFGVRVRISDDAEPSQDKTVVWRRIVIKSSATEEFPAAFGGSRVMGISPRSGATPGQAAYLFYDAILKAAKRQYLPVSSLLGYVMAHELGHLLLPADAHGDAGVMHGDWDAKDLKLMRHRALAMGPREANLIRQYLDSAR
jgi:hypothetical protein